MGQPKALLPIPPHNRALLRHVWERLRPLADHGIIIANDPTIPQKANIAKDVPVLPDRYPDTGTLGGIGTGLFACDDWAIVAACDMPFVNPTLFAYFQQLASQTDGDGLAMWDAVVPRIDGFSEPLHALYQRRCLPHIERRLATGERRANCFHPDVRVRYVEADELRRLDPALRSFVNANTPEEWQEVVSLLEQKL